MIKWWEVRVSRLKGEEGEKEGRRQKKSRQGQVNLKLQKEEMDCVGSAQNRLKIKLSRSAAGLESSR
jgi:hypothetical protein